MQWAVLNAVEMSDRNINHKDIYKRNMVMLTSDLLVNNELVAHLIQDGVFTQQNAEDVMVSQDLGDGAWQ